MSLRLFTGANIAKKLQNNDLIIIEGATVSVHNRTTGSLEPMFDDKEGTIPKSNPFVADDTGQFSFYIACGEYKFTVTKLPNAGFVFFEVAPTLYVFNNLQQLKQSKVSAGDIATIKGRFTENDGGGGFSYLIQALEEFGSAPDEQGDVTLDNGTIAVLPVTGIWNLRHFGAKGDGVVDDTGAILAWSIRGGNLFIPRGLYRTTSQIVFPPTAHVYGESAGVGTGGTLLTEIEEANAGASVIRVSSDFIGDSVFKFVDTTFTHNGSVTCHDFKIRNDLENGCDAHLLEVINGYDSVSLRNLNLLFSGANSNSLRMVEDNTIGAGAFISQSISLDNVIAIGDRSEASQTPAIFMRNQQESVLNAVKAFASPSSVTVRAKNAMVMQGCRGASLNGCSFALSEEFGLHIFATDRASQGIALHMCTFEDCKGGTVHVDGAQLTGGQSISKVFIISPRYQFPQSKGILIDGATGCQIENQLLTGEINNAVDLAETNIVYTFQLAKITDNSARPSNLIVSYPNALGEKYTLNQDMNLQKNAASLSFTTADSSKNIRWVSGQSDVNDFGWSVINSTGASFSVDEKGHILSQKAGVQGALKLLDENGTIRFLRLTSSNTVVVSAS